MLRVTVAQRLRCEVRLLVLVLFCLAGACVVQAQTTVFSYQGRATDNGQPANGAFDLRFILYDAPVVGAQQGPVVTLEDVVITNGIFTVQLDFGASAFPGAARFLEIALRPGASTGAFTLLTPRQPVNATPYAVRSLNAGTADSATNATTAVNFSGALGGDVTGNQTAATVERLRNLPLPIPMPSDNKRVLRYENDGVNPARFVLSPDDNSGGTITGVTVGTGLNGGGTSGTVNIAIGPGGVSTGQLADSSVTNAKIVDVAGSKITGTIPVAAVPAGSGSYIQNTTTPQASTNFSIIGNGTVNGELRGNIVAAGQFNLAFDRVLSQSGLGTSLFVGVGAGSMNNLNFGTNNTFVGVRAGEANLVGSNNSFFGRLAGAVNTASYNAFFGSQAGAANTTGADNAFFGASAGAANSTGAANAFFGFAAGLSNTDARENSFFGFFAGRNNTVGDSNSFFGFLAGHDNTASNNSFFGANAGESNTSGTNNAFFGANAGAANTFNNNNSFFGASAGAANTGLNNSFFGAGAGLANTTSDHNAFFGMQAGVANTSGHSNAFFGAGAGSVNTTGDNNTALGRSANFGSGNLNFATAIGAGAVVTTSDTVVIGRSDDIVRVPGFLRVVQLGSPGATPLCQNVNDTISTCSSSLRYKTNVQGFGLGLKLVNRLNPISFDWKDGGMKDVGFGAEDVAKIDARFVTYNAKGEVEGVKYDRLTTVLINAVKEQQAQITAQQQQLAALQNELRLVRRQVSHQRRPKPGRRR